MQGGIPLDDRKEKRNGADPANEGQALHDELEDLAKVFQEELDRAKAEAAEVAENGVEDPEILIQGLEDIPSSANTKSSTEEVIPGDELCECCEEHHRGTAKNPDSPYCEACDAALRHYPFEFLNVLLVLIVLAVVFYGGYVFAGHMPAFVAAAKADNAVREHQMYTALDAYSTAAAQMQSDKINGELVYKRQAMALYQIGYVSEMESAADHINAWEMQLPHFRTLKKALDDAEDLSVTLQAVSALVDPYSTMAASEIPYEEILGQLDALKTAEVTTDTQAESTGTSSGYRAQATQYNGAIISLYKYLIALMCEKDLETQIGFAEEIQQDYPQHVWLYGRLLSELYAKAGRDIEPICTALTEMNSEDDSVSQARAIALRRQGDYDASIALCEERIAAGSDMTYELYRQESLCYLLMGDYQQAYAAANSAFQSTSPSIQLCNTLALAALAAGQDDAFAEVKDLLEFNDLSVSTEVTGYQNGTLTIENILLEGDYDIT